MEWQCRGSAAALSKLCELHLDCQLASYELHGYTNTPLLEILPEGTSTELPRQLGAALLAADMPRLRSVQLVCSFDPDVEQLCRHLAKQASMRELRCALPAGRHNTRLRLRLQLGFSTRRGACAKHFAQAHNLQVLPVAPATSCFVCAAGCIWSTCMTTLLRSLRMKMRGMGSPSQPASLPC